MVFHLISFIVLGSLLVGIAASTCPSSPWSLCDKNALITGGSKGIGKACVKEFLALGARVVTCARAEADLAECVQEKDLQAYYESGHLHTVVADVSTKEGRDTVLSYCHDLFKSGHDGEAVMHCLVNNVGFNIRKKATDFSEEDYDRVMATNLKSAFVLSQECYPMLKRAGGKGSVVNVGSVAGGCQVAMKSGVVYAMTKAAMNQMTYNLACEWAAGEPAAAASGGLGLGLGSALFGSSPPSSAGSGVRVNAVCPWYVILFYLLFSLRFSLSLSLHCRMLDVI
jgi:NAD(P)-dependent dehydrogenase (short-subunit alcohol dehydrogenase family)